jgi:hypothetical protein
MMAHRFAAEFPAERVIRQRLDPPRRTYGESQQPARSAEAESLFRKGADQQQPPPAGDADPLRGEIAAVRQQQADDAAHLRRAVAALAVRVEAQEQQIAALAEKAEAVVAALVAARATDARPEPETAPAAEAGPLRKIDRVERALAEHGPCTARALATRMGWSQGSVGANLRHLVVRGRVRYTEPPGRGEAWVYEVAGGG